MARLDWYIRANLKLRHFQLLVALDDYRHLGKVAALLNVTQPALSKTLSELQQSLDVKLFERTGRGLQPTPSGVVLTRHARKVLQDLAIAEQELHGLRSSSARPIRIGVQHAWAAGLLPKAIAGLKAASPRTPVFIREGTMDVLLSELRVGNLDILLGNLPPQSGDNDYEERALFEDVTALVVRRGHPLLGHGDPQWEDVVKYPWVLPPPGSLLQPPLALAFGARGMPPPENYVESLSFSFLYRYLMASDAVATLPGRVAQEYIEAGQLAILSLDLARLMRPVGVLWLRARPLEQELFDLLFEALAASARPTPRDPA